MITCKVLRGGSWPCVSGTLYSSYCRSNVESDKYDDIGFRILQDTKRYITRGCWWGGLAWGMRANDLIWHLPNFKYHGTGFRVVCNTD